MDWTSIQNYLVQRVQENFSNRKQTFFTDPEDARIVKSIETGLNEIKREELSESELVRLFGLMAEGRQAAFDKKSHKRIWLRTQRLRYTFYSTGLLYNMDQEQATQDILNHLEKARLKIQDAWGENEINRLTENRLSDLQGRIILALQENINVDQYQKYSGNQIGELPEEILEIVKRDLGRSAVTNIYRDLFLRVVSELWVEYLTEMEALRVAIGLEAYAQRDPLVQYKNKGFEMFQGLMENMRSGVVNRMFTFQPRDVSRVQAVVRETS